MASCVPAARGPRRPPGGDRSRSLESWGFFQGKSSPFSTIGKPDDFINHISTIDWWYDYINHISNIDKLNGSVDVWMCFFFDSLARYLQHQCFAKKLLNFATYMIPCVFFGNGRETPLHGAREKALELRKAQGEQVEDALEANCWIILWAADLSK